MARSEDTKGPEAIIAFAHNLFEPQERDNGKKQFGCSILYPKGTDINVLKQAAVDAVVAEWGDKAKQWIKDEVIKSPFLDGDGKQAVSKKTGERHVGFAGHTFIRCISGEDYKPKVFDRKRNMIVDKADVPSGSRGIPVVNAFTWENKENGKGVSFGISMLQITRKAEGDEILGGGGGPDPDKFFEKIEDDGPVGDTGGKGAESLFG